MNENPTTDIVTKTEDDLRTVEGELERIGSSICSMRGGGDTWYRINCALEDVRNAIHNAYKMRQYLK